MSILLRCFSLLSYIFLSVFFFCSPLVWGKGWLVLFQGEKGHDIFASIYFFFKKPEPRECFGTDAM